jgi:membrane protein required for beta-lactamase induction
LSDINALAWLRDHDAVEAFRACRRFSMNVDRMVLVFAGFMVLLSLALTLLFSQWWLLLTAFVGVNLIQAGFTKVCPAAFIFKTFGARPGTAFE